MVTTLMMLAEIATLGLFKIKVFWNKGYNVIIFVHDVTHKILWHESNYIVVLVMWPKFGKCSISIRSFHSLNFTEIWPEKPLCLKDGIGSTSQTGTRYGLEILQQCGKRAKTRSQEVLGANSHVCKSYRGKWWGGGGGGAFWSPHHK